MPGNPNLNLAPMPGWIEPCLPTLVDKVPTGDQWLYEVKWDGYRVSLYIERGNVKIMTRGGNDWTKRFPLVATAAAALNVDFSDHRWRNCHAGRYGPLAFLRYCTPLLWASMRRMQFVTFSICSGSMGTGFRDRPLSDRRLRWRALASGNPEYTSAKSLKAMARRSFAKPAAPI